MGEWEFIVCGETETLESNSTVVTYYFTNIPENIVHEDLRQSFLTIGVLLNVFLSKRMNELGKRFGFVRFQHVRDKAKVMKAHNKRNGDSAKDTIASCFGEKHGAKNITTNTRSNFGGNMVTWRSFVDIIVGAEAFKSRWSVCGHDGSWITRFTYFENGGNALLAELCAIQLGIELVMISTLQTSFVKVTV
ncbi:RNA recognition motif [Medicago truncatula]|uniref:RNA recognition motif n=1 Tax=Medicago truncatula TaxID=3880 RepID=A0A072UKF6_MEDTR|nr:RNA recognition motif [Medicago truncatula]